MTEILQKNDGAVIEDKPVSDASDNVDVNDKKNTVSIDYEPNILDDYDLSTYHFRLFMMSPDGIRNRTLSGGTFDTQGKARRILIAESGATTIGIDDVSITSYPSPSSRYRMGTATNVRFTLSQPLGADLVDKIFAGANRLGLQHFSKVPFFLELSFRGRNPDRTYGGSIPGAAGNALIGDDELSNIIWVWPIKLLTMNMTVDSGGSMYTITAVAESDIAYSNQAADLEKRANLIASTVEEAFTQLEEHLASKETDKTETNQTQAEADTYTFYIDSKLAASKIVDKVNRSSEFNKDNPEKVELPYEPGTSIDKIIEDILSNTSLLQTEARGVTDEDEATSEGNTKAIEQTLYKVITDTQLGKFDRTRNDYARHYRYAIVPYKMSTINSRANKNANVSSQRRYDNLRTLGRLRKAYNYIYTGLNDQVFDFDISLNFSWYAVDTFMKGKSINAQFEPKAKEAEEKEGDKDKTDTKSLSDKLGLDPDSFVGELVDDAQDFVVSDDFADGVTDGIFTGNFDQLTGNTSRFLASNVSRGVRVVGNKIFPPYLVKDQFQEREQLIEDETVDENAINPMTGIETYLEAGPGKQHRISGGDIENPGKILLAQFFEQAAGPPSADLLSVSLRVKGDPFWLSPGPIGRNDQFKSVFDEALAEYGVSINHADPKGGVTGIQTDSNVEVTSMKPALSQQYFLFRNFTPLEADEETGLVTGLGANNAINGVFAARVIEHSFSGGQFTQTIDGWRDTRIAVKDLDLGIGVADTRGLLDQFNIEDIIDNPATIRDDIIPRQDGSDATTFPGGVQPIPDGTIDEGFTTDIFRSGSGNA